MDIQAMPSDDHAMNFTGDPHLEGSSEDALVNRQTGPKIYTKTGDAGETGLFCGGRTPKDDLRIEAYGSIDELNSILGVVSSEISVLPLASSGAWAPELLNMLEWMQERLFTLSSMIVATQTPSPNIPMLEAEDTLRLEEQIDVFTHALPPLQNFILPGGSRVVSYLHLARTVCRRAERVCAALSRQYALHPVILPFLNRLSDLLFVAARWVAFQQGETEKIWLGRSQKWHRKAD